MIKTLLIANRGEIACRIIRTARRLGIRCVAIYSDVDRHAQHVKMADEAHALPGLTSQETYLQQGLILTIAEKSGADAIHPGYGFLSENATFSRRCAEAGLIFVGAPATAIEKMGSKAAAKAIMHAAGVPVIPGYYGADQSPDHLQQQADGIGYPLLIKASAGGGGKGMRIVTTPAEFANALASAQREASASFGDTQVILEKYLPESRHIEVQVFADAQGQAVHLFERDCSMQRRHQKVLEEAPAPGISQALRQQLGQAAVDAALAIDYQGAGTIEFLLAPDGQFYFMEMNTRLQVEHPITECITGIDLVEWQLNVASGAPLPRHQAELSIDGHAIEVRLYAEDPLNQFLPAIGTVQYMHFVEKPPHRRLDTGVQTGDEISPYYDPMLAKLITWAPTREACIEQLQQALSEYYVSGLKTNLNFLSALIAQPAFQQGQYQTTFIEKQLTAILDSLPDHHHTALRLAILAYLLRHQQHSAPAAAPWSASDAWQSLLPRRLALCPRSQQQRHPVEVRIKKDGVFQLHWRQDDAQTELRGTLTDHGQLLAYCDGLYHQAHVFFQGTTVTVFHQHQVFEIEFAEFFQTARTQSDHHLTAPMPGTVTALLVSLGQSVKQGDVLLVMEAMKMEHSIRAPHDGIITEIFYHQGDRLDSGAELVALEPLAATAS